MLVSLACLGFVECLRNQTCRTFLHVGNGNSCLRSCQSARQLMLYVRLIPENSKRFSRVTVWLKRMGTRQMRIFQEGAKSQDDDFQMLQSEKLKRKVRICNRRIAHNAGCFQKPFGFLVLVESPQPPACAVKKCAGDLSFSACQFCIYHLFVYSFGFILTVAIASR